MCPGEGEGQRKKTEEMLGASRFSIKIIIVTKEIIVTA